MLTKIFEEKDSDIVTLYKRLHDFEKQVPGAISIDIDDYYYALNQIQSFTIIEVFAENVNEAYSKFTTEFNSKQGKILLAFITITDEIINHFTIDFISLSKIMFATEFTNTFPNRCCETVLSTHAIKENCDYADFKENVRMSVFII